MLPLLLSGWSNVWTFWSVLSCFFDHFNGYVMLYVTVGALYVQKSSQKTFTVLCVFVGGTECSPQSSLPQLANHGTDHPHVCAHPHTLPHAIILQFRTASSQTVLSVHGKQNRQPQVPQHGEETKKETKAARRRKKNSQSHSNLEKPDMTGLTGCSHSSLCIQWCRSGHRQYKERRMSSAMGAGASVFGVYNQGFSYSHIRRMIQSP